MAPPREKTALDPNAVPAESVASSFDNTVGTWGTDATPRDPASSFGASAVAGELGVFGKYRVQRLLGRGGMGAVYLAFDTRLQRQVALKVMLPSAAENADARERFLREARAAAGVSSDYVVGIYEADEVGDIAYIAMQFLKGSPLDEYLRQHPSPSAALAVRVGREVALGLAAAHELGLVHRDIKPGNLWLESPGGRVKILDFGLAKPHAAASELTASGAVVGTPAYLAPEQGRGHDLDGRADLFSLGCVMYRLCAGRLPFDRPTVMSTLMAIATEHPTPLRELNPEVPAELADLIARLMAKAPGDRPQSALAVAMELAVTCDAPTPAVAFYRPAAYAEANAFSGITEPMDAAAPRPLAAAPPRPPRRSPKVLVGSLFAGFLAVAFAGFIVIKVTNKDGSVTELRVPEGSKVEIDGKAVTPDAKKAERPVPVPWVPPATIPVGESAFDKLDPKLIPPGERFAWQPKELVAVIGTHARRQWWSIKSCEISPDGTLAATLADFHTATTIWDVTTQTARLMIPASDGAGPDRAPRLYFPPESQRVLSVDLAKGTKRLWNVSGAVAKLVNPGKGDEGERLSGCFWPEPLLEGGRTLFVPVSDNKFKLIDLTADKLIDAEFELPIKPGHRRQFAARTSQLFYTSKDRQIRRVTVRDAKLVDDTAIPIPLADGEALDAVRDDGKMVGVRGPQSRFDAWDLSRATPVKRFAIGEGVEGHTGSQSYVFSPDGRWLTGCGVATALWRIDGPEPKFVTDLDANTHGPPMARSFNSDGNRVVVGNGLGFVRFWDTSGEAPKELPPLDPESNISYRFAHDSMTGHFLVNAGKGWRIWDLSGQRPKQGGLLAEPWPFYPSYAGTGRWAQFAPELQAHFLISRYADGKFSRVGEPIWAADGATSPDGRTLLVYALHSGKPHLEAWDISAETPRKKWSLSPAEQSPAWGDGGGCFWMSADNQWFATRTQSGASCQLVLWRNAEAKPQVFATLPIQLAPHPYRVALSPDGRYLAHTPRLASEVVLFDLTGKEPREVAKYDDVSNFGGIGMNFAFRPDGKRLACGTYCGVRVLDVPTLRPVWEWAAPGPVSWLEWATDGRHLLTQNGNKTVYVLRLSDLR